MTGRKNRYTCSYCGFSFVTVDLVDGTTPFMTGCKNPMPCRGMARSSFYRIDQSSEPTHEWYSPSQLEIRDIIDPNVLQHVAMGGLLLRKKA